MKLKRSEKQNKKNSIWSKHAINQPTCRDKFVSVTCIVLLIIVFRHFSYAQPHRVVDDVRHSLGTANNWQFSFHVSLSFVRFAFSTLRWAFFNCLSTTTFITLIKRTDEKYTQREYKKWVNFIAEGLMSSEVSWGVSSIKHDSTLTPRDRKSWALKQKFWLCLNSKTKQFVIWYEPESRPVVVSHEWD